MVGLYYFIFNFQALCSKSILMTIAIKRRNKTAMKRLRILRLFFMILVFVAAIA